MITTHPVSTDPAAVPDVSVSARTDSGAIFTQDVFLDLNG